MTAASVGAAILRYETRADIWVYPGKGGWHFMTLPTDVAAQATCRNKCNDEEQACLKRTGNKGQCGDRAKQCTDKCK